MEESKAPIGSNIQVYLEKLKSYLSNPNLSLISSPKPWISDFASLSKFSKPNKEDLFNRGKENLCYFLPNYLIILLVVLFLGILSIPSYIITLMALAGLWAYLYSIKTLVLSGKEITPFHKNLVIGVAAILVTVIFAWEIVFYTCVFVFAASMAHAGFHIPPDKYGTYDPSEIPV